MKKRFVQFLCGAVMMTMSFGGFGAAFAEEAQTEVQTDAGSETESTAAEAETEAETETAETEKAADVDIQEDGKVLWTVENRTGTTFSGAELKEQELTLTAEDGTVHSFLNVDKEDLETPVLVLYGQFLAVEYQSKDSGDSAKLVEEGEEISFEEPETMYVVDDVYVRAEAASDSEAISVAGRGNAIKVLGELPRWYRISVGEGEGYISKAYVTEEKDQADQAVAAEAQARAQIAAQAEAEARAAAAAQAAQSQAAAQPQGRYEVSRVAYDDCDGSGHGYYEITYSDGSVETEEY